MHKNKILRECKRCVMDESDVNIVFDKQGVCNHCTSFYDVTSKSWFPNEVGVARWAVLVDQIKFRGREQAYDCILGLSGGVDSSYLALKVYEAGLRPLVMHVDAGWNTELATANIESIVNYCGYDLHTQVIDWPEIRDLQLAYLRAGISNQDAPQDHIFFASLYHYAARHGIKYVLSGGNIASESIFPTSWHGDAMDAINLKAIHRNFGENPLRNYRTISFFEYYFWYPFVKKMRVIRPLNYMRYDKCIALEELKNTVGYKPYARKHGESFFTKLFQNYYLPKKFGYDKRRPHLSSLIVSGQISRESALQILQEPLYEPVELETDINYFCKKMRITRNDFNGLIAQPNKNYSDFPNWEARLRLVKRVQDLIARLTGKQLRIYS